MSPFGQTPPSPSRAATAHIYVIRTGEWFGPTGELLGLGFSGLDDGDGVLEPGEGLNDPSATRRRGVGPLPIGIYRIGEPFDHPTTGPFSMRLTPEPGTEVFGRSGFLVHGGSAKVSGTSHGCVIQTRPARERINASPCRLVQVVAERPPSIPAGG